MPFALPLLFAVSTCSLDLAIGVTDSESLAIQDIVCAEVANRNDGAEYKVRIAKLGSQYVLRLSSNRGPERHLSITSLDEVTTAAPRLAAAHAEDLTVGETRDVDNVTSGEVRARKAAISHVHAYLGVVGGGTLGHEPGAGAMFAVTAGSARWSFVSDLRLTGNAFSSALSIGTLTIIRPKLDAPASFGSLAGGLRHHFLPGDTSPFVGFGIDIMHSAIRTPVVSDTTRTYREDEKTGFGTWAEAGLDVLRTSTVGGAFIARVDAPTYSLGTQWRPFGTLAFAMRF